MDCNVAPVDEEYLADFSARDPCRDTNEVKLECGRRKASVGSTSVDARRAENLDIILMCQGREKRRRE
jgi:hypothetical protein